MAIKNPKLKNPIGDKKPSMYKESKLFARKHPNQEDSQYKGMDLPDPDLEPLEPTDDEAVKETRKAINLLATLPDLKKAGPDTEGNLEGKFKVPLKEMIDRLNEIVSAEYSQWMRYYHYYLVLRGHCRDALAHEFEEHAKHELEHAEKVAMRVIGLGGYPATSMVHPEPLQDTEEILKEMIRREQEGMQLYRQVHALCGDNEGTRQVLEGNMELEQEHIDELWRYLKHPEVVKANMSAGRDTMPSEKQAKQEYSTSFARHPGGISGSSTPDLPERGKDWHPEEDDEKLQAEAQARFKKPKNLLENKSIAKSINTVALNALSNAPTFSPGPVIPPREREFLVREGFSAEEVETGRVRMSPRLRKSYNQWLQSTVRKSIGQFE